MSRLPNQLKLIPNINFLNSENLELRTTAESIKNSPSSPQTIEKQKLVNSK